MRGGAQLGARTARAAGWTLGARLAARLFDIAVILVLARVLGPEEFGLVALAVGVVQLSEAILEMPVAALIARERSVSRRLLDTCFTLGLLRGLLLAGALAAAAFPLATFYSMPEVGPLIMAIALAPIFRGILNPRLVLLARRLDYRLEVSIEVGSKAVASIAALVLGLATGSYWALALATILAPVLGAILSYIALPYRPRLRLSHWRRLRHAVGWNVARQVAAAFNWQIARLMAGRLVPAGALGHFSMADQIATLPRQVLVFPLLKPLVAGLAAARDGTQETALALGACRAVFALAGPVLVAAAVLAPEIVPMLLGAGWGPVVPLLSLLAAAQLFALLGAALPAIAIRVDRVDVLARLEILILCLRLPLLWFAMSEFGIIGAGYASLAVSLVTLVLSVRLLGRLLGTGPGAVARALLGPFLGLAAMTLALDAGRSAWLVGLDPLGLLIAVVVLTALAGLVHLAVMALAWQFSGRPPGLEHFCIEAAARRTRRAIGLQGSGV